MRWIITGVCVCGAVIVWVLHDLERTLARATRLPDEDDR